MDRSPLPPTCAARYVWERALASGGFGSVHLCTQANLGRKVVVKLLHGDALADAEQVARFQDEARITASIEHPNVVRVIDAGAGDVPWIAYELVPGQNLRQRLNAGRMPLDVAVRATLHVLAALSAAHARHVVHRDVKPENVLEADGPVFKVTDFGIAKWTRDRGVRTKTGIVLGTPAYMAPELIRGDAVGAPADLYSAGAMLHELVSGRPPFEHENPIMLLELHLWQPVPALPDAVRDRARGLEAVVQRALAKSPRDRFATADEMHAALASLNLTDTPSGLPAVRGGAAPAAAHPPGRPDARAGWRATVAHVWRSSGAFATRTRWALGACVLLVLASLVWAAIASRPPADLRAEVDRLVRETVAVVETLALRVGRRAVKQRVPRKERERSLRAMRAQELAKEPELIADLRRIAREVDRLGPYVLQSSRFHEIQLPFGFALGTVAYYGALGASGTPPVEIRHPEPGTGWLPAADRHWLGAVVDLQVALIDPMSDLVPPRAAATRRLLPAINVDALDRVGDRVLGELLDLERRVAFPRAEQAARRGGDPAALRDPEAYVRLALAFVEHLVRARRKPDELPPDVVVDVLRALGGDGAYDGVRRRLGDEASCLKNGNPGPGRSAYRTGVLAQRIQLWMSLFPAAMVASPFRLRHLMGFADAGAELVDLADRYKVPFALPAVTNPAGASPWVLAYLSACRGKHAGGSDRPIRSVLEAAALLEGSVAASELDHSDEYSYEQILLRFIGILDQVHEAPGKLNARKLDATHSSHAGCCRLVAEAIRRRGEIDSKDLETIDEIRARVTARLCPEAAREPPAKR